MWVTKIISTLFAGLLLYPVARTFYEMWIFERSPEGEERPEDFPSPMSDSSGPSFALMVSQTYYIVSPFDRFHRFLGFGPRRWVGAVGFSATIFVFILLAYSAVFPLKGASHSYEWKDVDSTSSHDEAHGAIITWDEKTQSTPEHPDESGRNGE